jgi:hypothetical protein
MALDLPTRKPGLWVLKLTVVDPARAGVPAVTAEHCIDAATDKLMSITGGSMRPESCSKQDVQKVGDSLVATSACQMGPFKIRWRAVLKGDFNSAYSVDVTMKQEGEPIAGIPAEDRTLIDAKWAGPCKPDQKPGDMIMGGRKSNVYDLQSPARTPGGARR